MLAGGDRRTDALVLSGGGAKGAYEIGVMKALFAGASPATGLRPLTAEVYAGTSVGAYNAAFLVSQSARPSLEGLADLERIWLQRLAKTPTSCGNGAFRLRGAPLQLGDLGCLRRPFEDAIDLTRDALFWTHYAVTRGAELLTSDAPLRNRVLDTIDLSALVDPGPFYKTVDETIDLGGLRASSRKLTILASNWMYGTPRSFDRLEIADRFGTRAILASAALPGIYPPVVIDGVPFIDGGILMNTPLKPAIRDGADVLHVIYLDPCLVNVPFPRYPATLDTFYRLWAIQQAQAFRQDIRTVSTINLELEHLRRLGIGLGQRGPAELLPFSRVLRRRSEGRGDYRPLAVHRYRPKTDLGGAEGLVDLRQDVLEKLIAEGYRDAVQHDCREAGCVLPPLGLTNPASEQATVHAAGEI
jgi:predicted acylesterase/phospholipase RssA